MRADGIARMGPKKRRQREKKTNSSDDYIYKYKKTQRIEEESAVNIEQKIRSIQNDVKSPLCVDAFHFGAFFFFC